MKNIRFAFGQVFRLVIRTFAPGWTVRKRIGKWGHFRISAKYFFSDFITWGGDHNSGFDYLISTARGKSCVFDVGAHIGLATLPMAKMVVKGGQVFAFEPSARNRRFLKQHLKANDIKNVTVVERALTNRVGEMVPFFELSDVSGMNGLIESRPSMERIHVQTSTIDEIVNEFQVAPELIKIDIEGAEMLCLQGARQTIDKYQPVIVLSVHPRQMEEMGSSTLELEAFVDEIGYQVWDLSSTRLADLPLKFGEYALEVKFCSS